MCSQYIAYPAFQDDDAPAEGEEAAGEPATPDTEGEKKEETDKWEVIEEDEINKVLCSLLDYKDEVCRLRTRKLKKPPRKKMLPRKRMLPMRLITILMCHTFKRLDGRI